MMQQQRAHTTATNPSFVRQPHYCPAPLRLSHTIAPAAGLDPVPLSRSRTDVSQHVMQHVMQHVRQRHWPVQLRAQRDWREQQRCWIVSKRKKVMAGLNCGFGETGLVLSPNRSEIFRYTTRTERYNYYLPRAPLSPTTCAPATKQTGRHSAPRQKRHRNLAS